MRTYLIEPQLLFVPFLKRILTEAGLQVVATSEDIDGKEIVAHDPAAVLVDVDFFERGAPNALCRIRQAVKTATVIAFSEVDDPTFEAACHISGATALVSKRFGAEQFVKALRAVPGIPASLRPGAAPA